MKFLGLVLVAFLIASVSSERSIAIGERVDGMNH